MKGVQFLWFVLYFLVGVYLLNINFSFFAISETISAFDNWVILAGGILCIFGGINHFRLAKIKRINRRVSYP
jgi:hypothetical protein